MINGIYLEGVKNWKYESKEMKYFALEDLPTNQNDPDLIEAYQKYLNNI